MALLRHLLRILGLEVLSVTAGSCWRRIKSRSETGEVPKLVLRKSWTHAVIHSLIHILPMLVLIFLIGVNLRKVYIGPTFTWSGEWDTTFLAAIQIASKTQELLCIASLTSMILLELRTELLGDGIPLGLLGAITWFTKITAFVSGEYLANLGWAFTRNKPGRWKLYLLLLSAGLISAFMAPATAILMTPRSGTFLAGKTNFTLDHVSDELFPTIVSAASEPGICGFENATAYAICPGGGYASLSQTFGTLNYTTFCYGAGQSYAPECQAEGASGNREWSNFLIQSPYSLMPSVMNSFRDSDFWGLGVAALQPHALTVTLMQALQREWNAVSSSTTKVLQRQFQWTYEQIANGIAPSPCVRVHCTPGQNLSADAEEALFPLMADNGDFTAWSQSYRAANISGLEVEESAHVRAQWVSLPIDEFGVRAVQVQPVGLLIELPWVYDSRIAVGCSVTAAWHTSTALQSVRSINYGAWGISFYGRDKFDERNSPDANTFNIPVELDESWLNLLTPRPIAITVNDGTSWSPTTIETMLTNAGFEVISDDYRIMPQFRWFESTSSCQLGTTGISDSDTDTDLFNDISCGKGAKFSFVEATLASIVADGLSRHGSDNAFDGISFDIASWSLRAPIKFEGSGLFKDMSVDASTSTTGMNFQMAVYVVGWAWYASNTADYLAMGLASVYLLLALWHLTVRFKRITSESWDTVTELLVLCQNSPPPSSHSRLANTNAGIRKWSTFRELVCVRSSIPEDASDAGRLRLVVGSELQQLSAAADASEVWGDGRDRSLHHDEADHTYQPLTPYTSRSQILAHDDLRYRGKETDRGERVRVGKLYK